MKNNCGVFGIWDFWGTNRFCKYLLFVGININIWFEK